MARERYAVDMDLLMVTLIQNYFGERADVAAASDVDGIERLPFIVTNAVQGQGISSGPAGLAWNWHVTFNILCEKEGEASDLADEVNELMHSFHESWDPNHGMIEGIGAIVSVDDISIPSKTAQAVIPAGGITQFDGTFSVTVRKA